MVSGIDTSNLDRSVSPSLNFYRFANGGWLQRNPIPAEYSRWGAPEELNELSNDQLRTILDHCRARLNSVNTENTQDVKPDVHTSVIGALYSTGLDVESAAKHGFDPVQDVLSCIDAVSSPADVVVLKARMSCELGVRGGLFSFYSLPDATNSSWEVACLSQSGALGIGDRDFYVLEDKKSTRTAYVEHVHRFLNLAASSCTHEQVEAFMELETSLAENMLTRTERRDPKRVYNKFENITDLAQRTETVGKMPWKKLFQVYGFTEEELGVIIVDNPSYLTYLAGKLETTPLETWKLYLRFHALISMADFLTPAAEEEKFEFYNRTMTGQKEMKPRWKRVLSNSVGDLLGDSLGMKYTEAHFSPRAKEMVLEMVHVFIEVIADKLKGFEWMEDVTKEKALLKLSKFVPKVGFPEKWEIDGIPELAQKVSTENSFAQNVRLCNVRAFKQVTQRINKPVDPNRWEMPAFMVNAYYHPLKNVIVFPAAILQPPFLFHPTDTAPDGDPAVNYSAIGAVICHEITHGFDDQGRQFDQKGELVDWWTNKDAEEYVRRAEKMVKLCNNFEVHGKPLNGKMCLGENIADFGGVRIAYEGLQKYQMKHGKLPEIDGFTAEQRFFLGWASIWRNNITKENALKRIIMDVHAPGEFRANIVQILHEFHAAFDVKKGDKMWSPPELRCDIW